jgi:hypothetical protein
MQKMVVLANHPRNFKRSLQPVMLVRANHGPISSVLFSRLGAAAHVFVDTERRTN